MGKGWSCKVRLCFSFSISWFVELQKVKYSCFNKLPFTFYLYSEICVWTQPLLQQPHIQKILTLKYCSWNLFRKKFLLLLPSHQVSHISGFWNDVQRVASSCKKLSNTLPRGSFNILATYQLQIFLPSVGEIFSVVKFVPCRQAK